MWLGDRYHHNASTHIGHSCRGTINKKRMYRLAGLQATENIPSYTTYVDCGGVVQISCETRVGKCMWIIGKPWKM